MKQEAAATKLQAQARGKSARCQVQELKHQMSLEKETQRDCETDAERLAREAAEFAAQTERNLQTTWMQESKLKAQRETDLKMIHAIGMDHFCDDDAARRIQAHVRGKRGLDQASEHQEQNLTEYEQYASMATKEKEAAAKSAVEAAENQYIAECEAYTALMAEETAAATKLQAQARGRLARKSLQVNVQILEVAESDAAARQIQLATEQRVAARRQSEQAKRENDASALAAERDAAARKIQTATRQALDRRHAKPVAPPPQFGVARAHTGAASHELIYEHEYVPKPVRKFNAHSPVECDGVLRPAVRSGRVAFRFFGARVPLSADHARSWLGHVLHAEVDLGRLQRVELLVPAPQSMMRKKPESLKPHDLQPVAQWHVWTAGTGLDRELGESPVEVQLLVSPSNGIIVRSYSMNENLRCLVYRILRQYCDDDGSPWRPIPEPPVAIKKVVDRTMPHADMKQRHMEHAVSETGDALLHRHNVHFGNAESVLVQALGRAEALRQTASLTDLVLYVGEVKKAFQYAQECRFHIKPSYHLAARKVLDSLLLRALDQDQEAGLKQLREVRDLGHDICNLGVHQPDSLVRADWVLRMKNDPHPEGDMQSFGATHTPRPPLQQPPGKLRRPAPPNVGQGAWVQSRLRW